MAAGIILLVAIMVTSFAIGARAIPFRNVIGILSGQLTGPDATIVWDARMPRTLIGVLGGAALGLAGALIQSLTRNPLAEPGLLGVNAGAGLAVAIGVTLTGASAPIPLFLWGVTGALISLMLVFIMGGLRGRSDPAEVVLAGVALGALMGGLSSAIALLNPLTFDRMRFWMAGSLDIGDLSLALSVLPVLGGATLAAMLLAGPLNALALGSEMATALGVRPALIQAATIAVVAILCGTVTAVTGPISFVGLMVPHLARWLVGQDMRRILLLSMTLAPVLLLASDILGRVVVAGELRVSVVTAFLGAPMLIWMTRRSRL